MNTFYVDEYFQEVLKIPLVSGRLFQPQLNKADYVNAIVVNERFVHRMGWTPESAIGQRIEVFNNHWDIIGVCKDFHYQSLSNEIEPLFMAMVNKEWPLDKKLLVRVQSKDDVEFVEAKWKAATQAPFAFTFLDDDFSKYYVNEESLSKMSSYFSGVSILLAGVGLIGLASLLTLQRTKEIGIRKIMGAASATIFFLLLRDFLVFASVGYLISVPFTWSFMNSWLSDFPYQVALDAWSFLVPAVMIFSVTVLTTGFQILRGAVANPIDALRSE
ncbi:FtsX-like permease family protein [Chryseolinea sp. T2]|uniref:ABC transporter permease n=1 Tax=Chryseolinea sp. T2 TaxID=3129255 RepID=UPI003078A3A2